MKIFFYLFAMIAMITFASCESDSDVVMNEDAPVAAFHRKNCPPGSSMQWVETIEGKRLHRASANCLRRFSICSVKSWSYECADDATGQPTGPWPPLDYNLQARTVTVAMRELPNKQILVGFPIGLKTDPDFIPSDFTTFGFDTDYNLGNGFIIKAGEYIPYYTSTEIRVVVDTY